MSMHTVVKIDNKVLNHTVNHFYKTGGGIRVPG